MSKSRKEITNLDEVKKPANNQNYCFTMIMLLANRFQSKLDSYPGEITLKQWLLLRMLQNIEVEDVSVNELAAVVGYSRQNVKKMVDILVNKGYLELKPSTTDKRAYQVKITRKTDEFMKEFRDTGVKIVQQLFQGIEEDELAMAAKVMEGILGNIEALS